MSTLLVIGNYANITEENNWNKIIKVSFPDVSHCNNTNEIINEARNFISNIIRTLEDENVSDLYISLDPNIIFSYIIYTFFENCENLSSASSDIVENFINKISAL